MMHDFSYLFWDVLASLLRHINAGSIGNLFIGVNTVNLGNLVTFGKSSLLRNLNRNFSADGNTDRPAFWGSVAIAGVGRLVAVPGVAGIVAIPGIVAISVVLGIATLTVSSVSLIANLRKEISILKNICI